MKESQAVGRQVWPALSDPKWTETCSTLQLWMQIVGKIRLALMPPINHSWGVTLYPSVLGVTTSVMPYGNRTLQIDFDFLEQVVRVQTSQGDRKSFPLQPMEVASFYDKLMTTLDDLAMPVRVWPHPVEVEDPIPFREDHTHKAYDAESAQRFWRVLLQTSRVFHIFRSRFLGKVSPVHLFWGALDLACTRFSGRPAPEHPSMRGLPDRVTRDAYSHEVSSCGFSPGTGGTEVFFYSYAYPEPPGYRESRVEPTDAYFDYKFGEFVLPYDSVRLANDPDATLMGFLQSTYDAASNCGRWDRAALEKEDKA